EPGRLTGPAGPALAFLRRGHAALGVAAGRSADDVDAPAGALSPRVELPQHRRFGIATRIGRRSVRSADSRRSPVPAGRAGARREECPLEVEEPRDGPVAG